MLLYAFDGDDAYPYHLGVHLATGQLCRIPATKRFIPSGFARVLEYREKKGNFRYKREHIYPNGILDMKYWSINRATDIDKKAFRAEFTIVWGLMATANELDK